MVENLAVYWFSRKGEDECRYYPWFYIYTKEKYDNFSEEEKHRRVGRVVYRGCNYACAYGGVSSASADYDASSAYADVGSHLAFSNRDLAEYAGKQFIDIWADFVFEISDNESEEDDE